MYYRTHAAAPPAHGSRRLERRAATIAERVPRTSYVDLDGWCPLQRRTDPWTIAAQCLPHCTGEPETDAVYVLECRSSSEYGHIAVSQLERYQKPWNGEIEGADRLLYVGRTVDVLRRLDEHLNSPGDEGAHFTTVFPPVRILDLSWWESQWRARAAEPKVAEHLRQRFPEDYVYQS